MIYYTKVSIGWGCGFMLIWAMPLVPASISKMRVSYVTVVLFICCNFFIIQIFNPITTITMRKNIQGRIWLEILLPISDRKIAISSDNMAFLKAVGCNWDATGIAIFHFPLSEKYSYNLGFPSVTHCRIAVKDSEKACTCMYSKYYRPYGEKIYQWLQKVVVKKVWSEKSLIAKNFFGGIPKSPSSSILLLNSEIRLI